MAGGIQTNVTRDALVLPLSSLCGACMRICEKVGTRVCLNVY